MRILTLNVKHDKIILLAVLEVLGQWHLAAIHR